MEKHKGTGPSFIRHSSKGVCRNLQMIMSINKADFVAERGFRGQHVQFVLSPSGGGALTLTSAGDYPSSMDWSRLIAQNLPRVAKGAVLMAASRMAQPPETEDPTEEFMLRKLELVNNYQKEREELAAKPPPPRPAPTPQLEFRAPAQEDEACPFCQLEEKTGYVKNHLQFVATECSGEVLAEATGGMVLKARSQVRVNAELASNIEKEGGQTAPLARLVVRLCRELEPKLEWIGSCGEAQEAARIAEQIWEAAAKAAQANFSHSPKR